jgi:hypothetical protein
LNADYRDAASPYLVALEGHSDARGILKVLSFESMNFKAARIFNIQVSDLKYSRGGHAHKQCSQLFFCGFGRCEIFVKNLSGEYRFELDPTNCLVVPPYNWAEIWFKTLSTSVTVLASHEYDPRDYIYTTPELKD